MKVLVAYATKHGATQGIAERIAVGLGAAGLRADVKPIRSVGDVSGYGAVVVGSAAYIGHWLPEATEFVRAHRAVLTDRPTWLFSSGPLGTGPMKPLAQGQRVAAEPKEVPELREAIRPRDHRVFSGALTPAKLGLRDRAIRTLPAGRALLPEGDFRDWTDIDAWAAGIASELAPASVGRSQSTTATRAALA
jgi:menaquinone-dependent protoporphyrinogen oxidase